MLLRLIGLVCYKCNLLRLGLDISQCSVCLVLRSLEVLELLMGVCWSSFEMV